MHPSRLVSGQYESAKTGLTVGTTPTSSLLSRAAWRHLLSWASERMTGMLVDEAVVRYREPLASAHWRVSWLIIGLMVWTDGIDGEEDDGLGGNACSVDGDPSIPPLRNPTFCHMWCIVQPQKNGYDYSFSSQP